jgi:phage shock protein E
MRLLPTLFIFALLFGALYVALQLYNLATDSPLKIDPNEARRRIAAGEVAVILDVRTDAERRLLGFYPHSVHVPSADIGRVIPSRFPDKTTSFLLYCNTGHRARMAADALQLLGYANVAYISTSYTTLMDDSLREGF